jgi:hypothetical protein
MAAPTMRELERVRYWQGQLLASGDLQTQIGSDAELRALHNRALHRAYGIAVGLTLSLVVDEEDKRVCELTCGVAYDCYGRALFVERNRPIPLPLPAAGPIVLVLSHDPESDDGIALTWKLPHDVNPNTQIAVAGLIFDSSNTAQLDPDFRRVVARPMARPRLATGTTIPGETPWKSWKIGDEEVGVQVTIDTSAAGYTQTPHYFAEAGEGKPLLDVIKVVDDKPSAPDRGIPQRDLVWFASIADPSPESFKLQLLLRGIARQAFDIADPKTQVAAVPELNGNIELNKADVLKANDVVARLLPIGERLSLITSLSNKTATLDAPLQGSAARSVAFGNLPRTTFVTKVSEPASIFAVTVDKPDLFNEGDVVVKLGAHPENARPAKIISVDDAGTLELSTSIAGLTAEDVLGIALQAAIVDSVTDLDVKVDNSTPFSVNDVVVRVGAGFENSTPAIVLGKKNDVLTLSAAIGLQNGSALAIATVAAKVTDVANNAGEVKIQVDSVAPFREGDLVAKITRNSASRPVRVQGIRSKSKTLTLSQAIAGLELNDVIAAASFPVRATVLGVADKNVTLADPTVFPKDAYVAGIDDLLKTSAPPVAVNGSIGKTLLLEAEIPKLEAGNVIGLCAFPPTVQVQAISADGAIIVSDADLIRAHDVVTARGGLALVAEASGTSVRLAAPIADLVAGDSLAIATIRGVVNIAPGSNNLNVKIDQSPRLRKGDFLADINGWRQATAGISALAEITEAGGNKIKVAPLLDGLLTNDTVGLATVTDKFLQFRLNAMPDIKLYDTVELAGFDRLEGNTRSITARVRALPFPNVVSLLLETNQPEFALRPEDISASVAFVRGSALALIQKRELFVNWLSCGEGDPLPKPCIPKPAPDCCTQSKE